MLLRKATTDGRSQFVDHTGKLGYEARREQEKKFVLGPQIQQNRTKGMNDYAATVARTYDSCPAVFSSTRIW